MTTKRHPGRPLVGREKRKRYLVTLEPATADRAREIGSGNLSGGVTQAVRAFAPGGRAKRKERT